MQSINRIPFVSILATGALCLSLTPAFAQHGVTPSGHPSYGNEGYLDQQQQGNGDERPTNTAGLVTGGNLKNLTLMIKSDFTGANRVVQLTTASALIREQPILPGDLKVNDSVHITLSSTGVATLIVAGAIPPALLPGGNKNAGRGNTHATQVGGNNAQAPGVLTGQVKTVSPLVVTVSGASPTTIKLSQSTRIARVVPVAFSTMKVGDHIFATGEVSNSGVFNAKALGISGNWNTGTMTGGMSQDFSTFPTGTTGAAKP